MVNNNYREVVATIPGVIVSEEPSSPIINFGYRGFDSQRSEFMQVLKDGISIKNEQFGFPETHYTPDPRFGRADRIHPRRGRLAVRLPARRRPQFHHENAEPRCGVSFPDQERLRHG